MLSGILNSDIAIQANISIMRAFVVMRQLMISFPIAENVRLQQEMEELKKYVEEIFTGQNDINEDARMRIELTTQALAGLQVRNKGNREPTGIGLIKTED